MTKNNLSDTSTTRIEQLERELADYRLLVANTPDLLYRTDLEGRIVFVSSSVEKLSGYTVAEAVGMNMAEEIYLHPEEREKFLEILREKGRVKNFQAQLKRKDGSLWWASTNAHFYMDDHGNVLGVEGITRDVDELKKAGEAQQKSEDLFRQTFHTSPDSINLNRVHDGMYININEGFTKLTGYTREEVIGKTSLSLNIWKNPEDREVLVEGLRTKGYVENLEAQFVCKDGTVIIGLMSARLLQINDEQVILSITRDITERIQLERQLQQAQKFEALGTLAGGIAHDFNNLLMGIQGRASLIGFSIESDSSLLEHVQGIEEYVRNATNLTKQILGFARRGKYETNAIDINELLQKSAEMFGRTNKGISLHFSLFPEPLVAEIDQQQFEQVFLNIFVNSLQAMPHGGKLILRTSTVTLSDEYCSINDIVPGVYIKISISDTGTGMDEETQQRAFDPFFTTKDKERGTGLGLASTLGIIKNHNGSITLVSQLNYGTTVTIYLPLSLRKPEIKDLPEEKVVSGGETILLVDDEELITDVGTAMLESLGYKVHTASSGFQAIDLLNDKGKNIDMVVLDLIMPEMDGEKTFTELRAIDSQIPVLLSSGYSMNGQALNIMQKGCNGFIQKPYNIAELSKKIREILEN
jgi:two-component system cell cycle sensor histidine kinase/response regulator CckA